MTTAFLTEPLVSCLCVTRGRPEFLRNALRTFQRQTHTNRELVVVHQGLPPVADEIFAQEERVRLVAAANGCTLGGLRQIALNAAQGKYVVQWDDDDWHAPTRIEAQLKFVQDMQVDGALLSYWVLCDRAKLRLYLGFRRRPGWEGSMFLLREAALKVPFPQVVRGEDGVFLNRFRRKFSFSELGQPQPLLYVYNFHGNNTWNRPHWESMFKKCKPLDGESKQSIVDAGFSFD